MLTNLQKHDKGGTITVIGWIDAPPSTVWKVLTDASLQPKIYSSVLSVEMEVKSSSEQIVKSVYDFPWPFDDRWSRHQVVSIPATCSVHWHRIEGTIAGNTGDWTLFRSEDGKSTLLYYRVFFDPGLPLVPDSLIRYGMQKEAPGVVLNLRRFLNVYTGSSDPKSIEMDGRCSVEKKS